VIETIRNAWKIRDLRGRMIFTLAMFLVYRIGAHVPVPGSNPEAMRQFFQNMGGILGFLDLFAGGALSQFSVFALGLNPYITSSIIVQLLTFVIPSLEQLVKEGGEEASKTINKYTRYGTIILALIQGTGMVFWLRNIGALASFTPLYIVSVILTWTAGSVFLMWLGEQITEKGIGNGISLLIFLNIVSSVPTMFFQLIQYMMVRSINILSVAVLVIIGLLMIAGIVAIQEGERRIPVQYSKRVIGRKVYGGQSTHIPIKVNQAGVIPVIFSSSVLLFPATIAQFIQYPIFQRIAQAIAPDRPIYMILYLILIIFFTYFYTAITFNPINVSKDIQKHGGFIPGIRPGRPTSDYINRILTRITLVGAIFLGVVAVLPTIITSISQIPGAAFGGTSIIIMVGVTLETVKQIEARMLMRHYQGFMK
jgi:preprotein translocase subunit SecY